MNSGSDSRPSVISARGLVRHYEAGRVRAVDGVDMNVRAGELVAICGPSGCGKTTLLNLIAAIDRPDSGTLKVCGESPGTLSPRQVDAFRRCTIGLIFQLHNLLPDLTALENVEVPMLGTKRQPRDRRERTRALLERVGLERRQHVLPNKLSGGERQRVAIARSLVNEPQILLADEPTGAIDSQNSERLLELLAELQRDAATTIVVVTHNPQVAEHASRILHMLDGQMAA